MSKGKKIKGTIGILTGGGDVPGLTRRSARSLCVRCGRGTGCSGCAAGGRG